MMTALKLYGHSLLANARVSAAASPLATRPRSRSLVVCAAKANGPPAITQAAFVEKLAEELGTDKDSAKKQLKTMLDLIESEVSSGNKINFQG